ncbi:MAG TPA: oligosaccharide flippase family protein [Solirubrobacteraceae bacterium]|nr:oligosaccharide flippase family protein [Solirubrobacteraceae bacterium]
MYGYLKRLVASGAAYQVGDAVAKVFALALLPVYTRYLAPAAYGTAEVVLTLVLSLSIVVRFGVVEAFVRFYYLDDDEARRRRVTRTATGFLLATTTLAALALVALADPASRFVLGHHDAAVMRLTALGLWAFTNLEGAQAVLRVDERRRTYLVSSLINVGLTISLTVYLVVVRHGGVHGYVAGNYIASAVVLVGLWWVLRERLGLPTLRVELPPMLRFGLPTVPAELSVYALNVIDRVYLYRASSAAAAGLYSLAVKLAAVIIAIVRAFQYAYPPLAYSVRDDAVAARLYATVTTYYVLLCGFIVAAAALLGRWVLRVFAKHSYFAAHRALPWVALGWALYGLFLVLVVLAGRARVTTRNVIAASAGVLVNVIGLVVLVGPLGIAGAGIALCAAYVVMLAVMYRLTRNLFPVAFEWRRLIHAVVVIAAPSVLGELLLPTSGAVGFVTRVLTLAAIPALLVFSCFLRQPERARLRSLAARALARSGA